MQMDEKFLRHIGEPIKFKIGEDEFEMAPVPNKYTTKKLAVFRTLAGIIQSVPENTPAKERGIKIMEKLDTDTIETLELLMLQSLKKANPDANEEVLKDFIGANFFMLLGPFTNANQSGGAEDEGNDSGESGKDKTED